MGLVLLTKFLDIVTMIMNPGINCYGYCFLCQLYNTPWEKLGTFARTCTIPYTEGLSRFRPAITSCSLVGFRPASSLPLSVMAKVATPEVESINIVSAHRGGHSWVYYWLYWRCSSLLV